MRDTRPLSVRIHEHLRTAILDVSLVPGVPIVEGDIARHFGTSRTPVREALLRLADEGMVEIQPQRGTYVAQLSLARIEESLFVRQAIECAVIRRIVARKDRGALCTALARIVHDHADRIATGDVAGALDCDTRFHRSVIEASGLPGIWDAVARVRELHHRIRAIAVPELGTGQQAVADHRRIVTALRSGDADSAEDAMAAHLARNLTLARNIAARHPDYFEGLTPQPK